MSVRYGVASAGYGETFNPRRTKWSNLFTACVGVPLAHELL